MEYSKEDLMEAKKQRTRLQAGADSLDSVGRAAGTGAG